MKAKKLPKPKNDADNLYTFFDETTNEIPNIEASWKLLVVAADENLFNQIKELVSDFRFQDKTLQLFYASSRQEGQQLLARTPNLVIMLLAFALEETDEIKPLIDYVRKDLNNKFLRIFLYSNAPISKIEPLLFESDISHYLVKEQINKTNLFSLIISSIRSLEYLQKAHQAEDKFTNMLTVISRFVPQNFLKILGKNDISEINLKDHVEKQMAILFFDIRGFTSLSELLTPLETFEFINNFVSYLEPQITANNGYVDKYIGDSFMALFPESSDDAIRAGISMLRSLDIYNYERLSKYQTAVKIGIGINSGEVVMGVIGFYDRMECTAMSSAVNAASRLEGITKILGANLLISSTTFKALTHPEQFCIRALGSIKAVGRREFVFIYEIFDADPIEILELKKATKADFEQGIKLIQNGDLIAANEIFKKIVLLNPRDLPAKYFLEKTTLLES